VASFFSFTAIVGCSCTVRGVEYASFELERDLWQTHGVVVAVDEVGRGSWAGPVMVGACAVRSQHEASAPMLADSKLLSKPRRAALAEEVRAWAATSVGEASASEIDEFGMARALRLACERALSELGTELTVLLQDGSASWVPDSVAAEVVRVIRPKLDITSAACAAASIVAKERRDAWMREHGAAYPQWPALVTSAGYGTKAHAEQIREHGVCELHRKSWSFVEKLLGS
jgi:ribonuclease HII